MFVVQAVGRSRKFLDLKLEFFRPGKSRKSHGPGKLWKMGCSTLGILLGKGVSFETAKKSIFLFMSSYDV